jgi:hypothetical protein
LRLGVSLSASASTASLPVVEQPVWVCEQEPPDARSRPAKQHVLTTTRAWIDRARSRGAAADGGGRWPWVPYATRPAL